MTHEDFWVIISSLYYGRTSTILINVFNEFLSGHFIKSWSRTWTHSILDVQQISYKIDKSKGPSTKWMCFAKCGIGVAILNSDNLLLQSIYILPIQISWMSVDLALSPIEILINKSDYMSKSILTIKNLALHILKLIINHIRNSIAFSKSCRICLSIIIVSSICGYMHDSKITFLILRWRILNVCHYVLKLIFIS